VIVTAPAARDFSEALIAPSGQTGASIV
jgi:hypothetical protein